MAKLTQEALDLIRSDEKHVFNIAQKMNRGFRTVEAWIKDNKEDGPLTRLSAIEIIKKETGLTEDQIIERAAVAAA